MDFDPRWDERLIAQAQALLPGPQGRGAVGLPERLRVRRTAGRCARPATDKVLAHVRQAGRAASSADHPVLGFEAQPVDSDAAAARLPPGRRLPVRARQLRAGSFRTTRGSTSTAKNRRWPRGCSRTAGTSSTCPACRSTTCTTTANPGAPPRPLHWDAAQDARRSQTWWQLEQRSRERLAALLAGEPLGVYGLGSERTMADYAAFSGIDYAARTLGAAGLPAACAGCAQRLMRASAACARHRSAQALALSGRLRSR